MTDRELLELAAKAAGIEGHWHECRTPYAAPTGWLQIDKAGAAGHVGSVWNPLDYDAEALRLAVKLKIEFYIGDDAGVATYAGYFDPARPSNRQRFAIERHGDDPYAATRRAIVRAAAEVERAMT